jgi:hypothetical protein
LAEATTWEIVQVDLVRPWKVKTPSCTKTLRCFTAIDSATSWPEICEITDKRSQTVMDAFNNNWICRYPRPIQVTFDMVLNFKAFLRKCVIIWELSVFLLHPINKLVPLALGVHFIQLYKLPQAN